MSYPFVVFTLRFSRVTEIFSIY